MTTGFGNSVTRGEKTKVTVQRSRHDRDQKRTREDHDSDVLRINQQRGDGLPAAKRRGAVFDKDTKTSSELPRNNRMQSSKANDETTRPVIPVTNDAGTGTNMAWSHHHNANQNNSDSVRALMELSFRRNLIAYQPAPPLVYCFYPNFYAPSSLPPVSLPFHPYASILNSRVNALHHSAFAPASPLIVANQEALMLSSFWDYNGVNGRCVLSQNAQRRPNLPPQPLHTQRQIAPPQPSPRYPSNVPNVSASTGNSNQLFRLAESAQRPLSQTLGKTKRSSNFIQKANQPNGGLSLYVLEDHGNLNDHQIYLRMQIEYFRATQDDILSLTRSKNKPIVLQQVGIRCRHCCHVPVGRRKKGSTYFPSALMGIYQAAQNLSVEHLQSGLCPEVPLHVKNRFAMVVSAKKRSDVSGGGKKYWADSGAKFGLIDTDDGIRFAVDVRR